MATKRGSGNPATQAQADLTSKQQRDQRRQEKLVEYQKHVAKRRRTGIMWWVVGGIAALAVVGIVVASFVFAPKPAAEYEAGSSGATIEGVETFENATKHVEGEVDYPQTPPAGGEHNIAWLNCAVYTEPQQNEYAVHSLEHGAVWVTYDPEQTTAADVETLKGYLPGDYVILSPFPGMDTPVAISAWNAQLLLDSADDERISEFFEEYWRSQDVPEPGASCSGAIDGPGKQ